MSADTPTGTPRGYGPSPGPSRPQANRDRPNWGKSLIDQVLFPIAIFGTPLVLAGMIVFFIIRAFAQGGTPAGFRAFAAVLLPLMILTVYVALGRKPSTKQIPGSLAFAISVAVALGAMFLLTLSLTLPVVELVFSAALALIIYVWSVDDASDTAPYSLGMILGTLGYIVVLGVPNL
ncbi:MAG: hypothetical protein ACRDTD_06180 [Pseudonocardiaceae bacterium]